METAIFDADSWSNTDLKARYAVIYKELPQSWLMRKVNWILWRVPHLRRFATSPLIAWIDFENGNNDPPSI